MPNVVGSGFGLAFMQISSF